MKVEIIKLPIERWEEYKNLRLEAYRLEPTAYESSYEEAVACDDQYWKDGVEQGIFAEVDGQLVGMLLLLKNEFKKRKHVVTIFAVYVKPEFRGQGIGKKLMEAAISEAKKIPGVIKIDLDVTVGRDAALKLYKSFGFDIVGTYGKDMKIDGYYYDVYEMEKFFDEPS